MNDRPLITAAFDERVHPAAAFEHPSNVVADPHLTLDEKRAVLASWASDACAVEAAPEFRTGPRGSLVRYDDIMDALRALDRLVQQERQGQRMRPVRHRRTGDSGAGAGLH
jgi:hypothetical protein